MLLALIIVAGRRRCDHLLTHDVRSYMCEKPKIDRKNFLLRAFLPTMMAAPITSAGRFSL
jgi:hypothetical protein